MKKNWSSDETEKLKSCYQSMTNEELIIEFPDRTILSIYKKAKSLGMYKKSEVEWKNRSNARKGNKSSSWKGGRKQTKAGYIMLLMPEHHRAEKSGYVMEHIVVFERETGITVPDGCCVHHINGDKSDNRISNLCMMTHKAHTILHSTGRKHDEEAKKKMSEKAKKRLSDKRNHPFYKEVDIKAMMDSIGSGKTITEICKEFGICKSTFYEKKRSFENGTE
jgi:hypothetical protein